MARRGEDLVAAWYVERGHEIVARNWRSTRGEIDIIARKGRLVVICEVKTRTSNSHGSALEAVGVRKQERLRRATCDWLEQTQTRCRVRFDVAAVTGTSIEVIEDAF